MLHKVLKKLSLLMALVMSVSLLCVCPVAASSILDEATETDADHAEDTSYSRLRGNHLNFGTSGIQKLSSNTVYLNGITQCHHDCDTVYLTLALERKVNGTYSTYKIWDFTDSNVSTLARGIEVIVPGGYYYRVRGYHAAKDGSKESTTTLTKGILVD